MVDDVGSGANVAGLDMLFNYLGWYCHDMSGSWSPNRKGRSGTCVFCLWGVVLMVWSCRASMWPHSNDYNSANIKVIALIFVAYDSPVQDLLKWAIICLVLMVGTKVTPVSLWVPRQHSWYGSYSGTSRWQVTSVLEQTWQVWTWFSITLDDIVMVWVVVGHPTRREGVAHACFVVGGSTDGVIMQSQHVASLKWL